MTQAMQGWYRCSTAMRGRFYGKGYEAVVTNVDDPSRSGGAAGACPPWVGEDVGVAGRCRACRSERQGSGVPRRARAGREAFGSKFAAGDPSRPIWSSVFWGSPE